MFDLIKGILGDMGGTRHKKVPLEKVFKGLAGILLKKLK